MSDRYWIITEPTRGEQRKENIYAEDQDDEEALRRAYPEHVEEYDAALAADPDLNCDFKEWVEGSTSDSFLLVDLGPAAPMPGAPRGP